jgi:hypothetical protein
MAAETYSPAEYKALLRADFASFARHSFHLLNPRTPFAPGWHFEVIAAKLAAVRAGHIRRLIVNKTYHIEKIEYIFHPALLRRPVASLDGPGWNVTGNAPAPPTSGGYGVSRIGSRAGGSEITLIRRLCMIMSFIEYSG